MKKLRKVAPGDDWLKWVEGQFYSSEYIFGGFLDTKGVSWILHPLQLRINYVWGRRCICSRDAPYPAYFPGTKITVDDLTNIFNKNIDSSSRIQNILN